MVAAPRVRMTPDDRRRQLVGIGLRKFVERPVQELSLDEVAIEAGVSRGLLFHYFPTKTDYHRAVVEAARRRVGRNVSPDPGAVGEVAVRQVVERFLDQVARRRETYVALVLGQAPIARAADDAGVHGVREHVTGLVSAATGIPDAGRPAVHGWVAYLEDRALQWSAQDLEEREHGRADLVEHCVRALAALVGAEGPAPLRLSHGGLGLHTSTMEFTTELLATGGSTTGFDVPGAIVDELGGGRRPKVTVTVNGHTWRTSIAPMGGRFMLGASAAVRTAAMISAGETYTVTVALDTAPRTVEVPEDLAAALAGHPDAAAAWERLSSSHQRQHAEAVLAAKKPETRARRVASTITALTS